MIRFGSVCSGIEAATVAWSPLGWEAAWLSEIDKNASKLLAHHYPGTPNLGDMTTIAARVAAGEVEAPDVFTGGTPCQAFSVAGRRQSLADDRGNLTLTFCEIANAIDDVRSARGLEPSVIIWENVPGVLTTKDNAFGCFLAELSGEDCALEPAGGRWADAGYVLGPKRAIAWRVLDAQYFGLAQRRRRVFVVASARDGFCPAEVLFESEGVRRDSAPRREAEEIVGTVTTRTGNSRDNFSAEVGHLVVGTLNTQTAKSGQSAIRGHLVFGAMARPDELREDSITSPSLTRGQRYATNSPHPRWLTERECERLMGFCDDYTSILGASARYKALGNSWAVPVARWVGQRADEAIR